MQHDHRNDMDAAVVFVKFGHGKRDDANKKSDEVVLRLLNESKDRKKMLTLRISRQTGTISIQESTITTTFFFESNRDQNMDSINKPDIMKEMETDYVGFWIMYRQGNVRKLSSKFVSIGILFDAPFITFGDNIIFIFVTQ